MKNRGEKSRFDHVDDGNDDSKGVVIIQTTVSPCYHRSLTSFSKHLKAGFERCTYLVDAREKAFSNTNDASSTILRYRNDRSKDHHHQGFI